MIASFDMKSHRSGKRFKDVFLRVESTRSSSDRKTGFLLFMCFIRTRCFGLFYRQQRFLHNKSRRSFPVFIVVVAWLVIVTAVVCFANGHFWFWFDVFLLLFIRQRWSRFQDDWRIYAPICVTSRFCREKRKKINIHFTCIYLRHTSAFQFSIRSK